MRIWLTIEFIHLFFFFDSLLVRKIIENIFDFVFRELSESGVLNVRITNLYLISFEVARGDRLEYCDSNLDSLSGIPVPSVFLKLFLQLAHRLLFFGASRDGGEADHLPRRVHPVAGGTFLFVAADEGDIDAERSHARVLGILVEVLSESLRHHVDGRAVRELHFEIGGLLSHQSDDVPGIIHVSHDDGSAVIADLEDIGY